jgi:outer membrane protein TolC
LLAGCARFESRPLDPARTAALLEARSIEDPGLREFIETSLHHEFSEWPPPRWDFQALTLAAFYYHPSLDVARAQWGVAKAGVHTAGGRPNPVLSVTPGVSANPPHGVSPWFPSATIDVPIETAGKRLKRITHARHLSEAARLNILATAWQVRSELRTVVLESNALQRRVELLQRQLELQSQVVTLLEQRLAGGAISATEVAPARIARLRFSAEESDARRQLTEARVRVAASLGLPASAVRALVIDADSLFPSNAADPFPGAAARELALTSRPDVLAVIAEYAAAESALHLEIAKQYPDVHLNPGYQFDQGEHKWSLGLSMELPVLNRNQGPIAEAEARRVEVAARFLALQARVIAEIDKAVEGHAAVQEQFRNSEAILQAQKRQAASLESAFQAGGADRLEAASARLEAALAEMPVLDARSRAALALGHLEDALQVPFSALKSLEQNPRSQTMKDKP